MDPNQTLVDLLLAIKVQDRQAAYDALEDLLQWLSEGGFFPDLGCQKLQGTFAGLQIPLYDRETLTAMRQLVDAKAAAAETETTTPDLVYRARLTPEFYNNHEADVAAGHSQVLQALGEQWLTLEELAKALPDGLDRPLLQHTVQTLVDAGIVTELERLHADRTAIRSDKRLQSMLLMTEFEQIPTKDIAQLDDDTFWQTVEWAMAEIYAASDNPVMRYPMPAWLRDRPRQSIS